MSLVVVNTEAAARLESEHRAAMIAPGVGDPMLLTRSPARAIASAADLAPATPRAGSLDHRACPSRFGNLLRHRDGRITDLNGNLITEVPA